jgi:uncharacterized membrane protein
MPGRQGTPSRIEDSIAIERSVEDVFTFYSDFRNLPLFLGDVVLVELTGDRTSRWIIKAPLGFELHWTVVVNEIRSNALIAYAIESVAVPTRWVISFSPAPRPGATLVREVMSMPGGLMARLALAAIGKPPAREVRANLKRLKELLETGRVTTMDYAVPGKFTS